MEIIGEAPAENAEAALQIVERLMIKASDMLISVPAKCDGEIMKCWYGENLRDTL